MKRLLIRGAGAMLLVLIAAEIVLRALGYSSPQWLQPDPGLGWSLRPGLRVWFSEEGRSFVTINTAGQRDLERSMDKPDGVFRIAVLGDAYSEAMHVPLDKTYWSLLGSRLQACAFQEGRQIEVLNFGVRGYGTAQAYVMLETRALRYRPDLVLLQFTNGSDVRDNSFVLDPRKLRPFFLPDASGRPRLDDSFASAPEYLRRASLQNALFWEVANWSRVLQYGRAMAPKLGVIARADAGSLPEEIGLVKPALAAPREPVWEAAWHITEFIIASMRELVARNGAQMAIFTVPYAAAVHPDARVREGLAAKYGVPNLAYPDRRIASFARAQGIFAMTLVDEMQALAARTGRPLYGFENLRPGFGHWNELGHHVAADIMAQKLCAFD